MRVSLNGVQFTAGTHQPLLFHYYEHPALGVVAPLGGPQKWHSPGLAPLVRSRCMLMGLLLLKRAIVFLAHGRISIPMI